jgi:phosphatidylglycerol lysyltransferase
MNAANPMPGQSRSFPTWLRPALAAATLFTAALVVDDELLTASWSHVEAGIRAVSIERMILVGLVTLAGLLFASAFDFLAQRNLSRPVRWRASAATSMVAHALSQGGALGAVAAHGLRARTYGLSGRKSTEAFDLRTRTAVIAAAGAAPLMASGLTTGQWAFGAAGLAAILAYLVAPRLGPLVHWIPPRRSAAAELIVSSGEWIAAALAFYLLLPAESRGTLLALLPLFGAARFLGVASGMPAGIGVFDAVILAALKSRVPVDDIAAALILHRLAYSAAPLVLAACRVALSAAPNPFRGDTPTARARRDAVGAALPGVLGLLVFVSGVFMLTSAATPGAPERLKISAAIAPLVILETSHFIDSMIGALLLFLAFGLNNRLRKAWRAALILLTVGAFSTLLRGLNIEEAIFLTFVACLLLAGAPAFYRTAPLRSSPLTPGMALSIVAAMAAVCWLGFFTFRHVAYRDELWWTFVADEGAPRLLRASVGVAVLALALFAWRLIHPRAQVRTLNDPAELARVEAVLAEAEDAAPDANLAFLGDKQFLFSPSGRSFVQYATRHRNWVALGEPVGPAEERREMIWAFRELCDRHGARPVFYAVRRDSLADFVDCGLVAAKIGENAVVDLSTFTLSGRARQDLRTARSRAEREGLSFAVLAPSEVEANMEALRAISDAWLETHQGEEKGFSLGRFDPDYIRRFDMAVLKRGDEIVCFVNLWRTPDGRRLAVDLMRYAADAPPGAMEALLVELLVWAQSRGFASCDLGRTPLAGLESHRLAGFMTRLGALIYSHADRFYGFDGLRRFKAKFQPRWESIYIAAPTGWHLPAALGDAALLSSGGVRGLFK